MLEGPEGLKCEVASAMVADIGGGFFSLLDDIDESQKEAFGKRGSTIGFVDRRIWDDT